MGSFSCRGDSAFCVQNPAICMLIRNPAMPSDEPSNKKSVNTGLRLTTTPALTLVGFGRA